jgi:hypothetical protein
MNGGEEAAKRFFEYQAIDAYEGARVHRKHANARGIAGPSYYGLADPVQFCAISLLESTVAVLQLRPTISAVAAIEIAEVLID